MAEAPAPGKQRPALVAVGILGIVLGAFAYLMGLFIGLFGFCVSPHGGVTSCNDGALGAGALILLAVLVASAVLGVVFRFRRGLWLLSVAALFLIVVGWAVTYGAAGFTALGV